ncbi:MAG: AMIN domain-containing protein [Halioglobus sp.]
MSRPSLPIAILIPLLAQGPLAQGSAVATEVVQVEDIRVGLTPTNTRLVFDLSGPAHYRLSTLDNPARVVIEFPGGHSMIDSAAVPLQGTSIKDIRTHGEATGSLSVLVDVAPGTSANAFMLKPYADKGHRLVLDLQNPADMVATSNDNEGLPTAGSAPPADNRERDARLRPPPTTAASLPSEPREYSGQWSGFMSIDARLFFHSPKYSDQTDQDFSTAFKPEYYVDWSGGAQQFGFSPFFRYDTADDQRTHADIRELYWRIEHDRWVAKVGLDVVFWGVTESQHLVDIINQTDLVENIDGEEKLGQPMLNLDYLSEWGNWQLYVLPYFRERTFPGKHGRLRTDPEVDTRSPEYDSSAKQKHVDLALRWSHNIGDWDIGLAHFSGTGREPYLTPDYTSGNLKLIPQYLQIEQTSPMLRRQKGPGCGNLKRSITVERPARLLRLRGWLRTHNIRRVANTPADLGLLFEYR